MTAVVQRVGYFEARFARPVSSSPKFCPGQPKISYLHIIVKFFRSVFSSASNTRSRSIKEKIPHPPLACVEGISNTSRLSSSSFLMVTSTTLKCGRIHRTISFLLTGFSKDSMKCWSGTCLMHKRMWKIGGETTGRMHTYIHT